MKVGRNGTQNSSRFASYGKTGHLSFLTNCEMEEEGKGKRATMRAFMTPFLPKNVSIFLFQRPRKIMSPPGYLGDLSCARKKDFVTHKRNYFCKNIFSLFSCMFSVVLFRYTARPLVQNIFEGGMATCFAYGKTQN